ncbi:hypothetical protein ACFQZC_34975 [Streptacidiphilus monticola]
MAAVFLACSLAWWVAFYPGLMSYDSFTYTWEATTGHWINDHSIPYVAGVWLSLHLSGTYAPLTFCQIVAAAGLVGYLAAGLERFAIRRRWIAGAVVLCGVLPPTGEFFVFVWKDVPFVLGALAAAGALLHLVGGWLRVPRSARRSAPGRRAPWLVLGVGMLLMCLARNNGFLTVVCTGLVLLACVPWHWRRIASVTAVPVLVYVFLVTVVYPAAGVQPQKNNSAYSFFYADLAYGYSKDPGLFTKAQLSAMAAVAPLEHWRTAGAQCWDSDPLTISSQFHAAAATTNRSQLLSAFTTVLKRAPQYVADAQLCRAHNAWAVFPDHPILVAPVDYTGPYHAAVVSHPELAHNPFHQAFHSRPLSRTAHRAGHWWYDLSRTPQLEWILWGGAVWCYLTYAWILRLTRRVRRRELLAAAAVMAGLQLTVLIATPAPLYRYMAGPTVLGVLLLPLACSRLRLPEDPP